MSENEKYKKDYCLDGWPIIDTDSGYYLSTDDIVRIMNKRHEESRIMRHALFVIRDTPDVRSDESCITARIALEKLEGYS